MESRWYLLPGQSVDNTKISDRGHALHISRKEWNKITAHLGRKEMIADAIEKERAHKQALKEGSNAMKKNWPDSIEHMHLHKEEERKKRAEELEEQRMENYNQLRKEQAEIKDEFIQKVKLSMFYKKTYPRNLNSALMESEALFERKKQLEFKKIIDQHHAEGERKYAESVSKAAEDERRENEEKAKKESQKRIELRDVYLREMSEKQEEEKRKKEKRKQQELIDNENARREIELEKQIRFEDAMIERAERKRELEEYRVGSNECKRMLKKENDEVDEVIQVFGKAKYEIECLKREKLKKQREQETARKDVASRKLIADAKAKDEAFEQSIKLAQQEAEAREETKDRERKERQLQLRKDRKEDHRDFLQRKEEEDRMIMESKKWDMLNRLKCDEITKEYNNDKMKEKWEGTIKYRNELLKQIEDDRKRRADNSEKKIADEYMLRKIKETDDEFFEYADKLVDYAKKNNRPVYPILKVVEDYKKKNSLTEKNPNRMFTLPNGTVMNGNVKMLNVTPGKMSHDPKADPNYRRCKCHKEEVIS